MLSDHSVPPRSCSARCTTTLRSQVTDRLAERPQFDRMTAHLPERVVEYVQAIATESHQPSSLDPISFADSNSKIRLEKPSYASPELRPQQGYAHREKLSMFILGMRATLT